MTVERPDWGHGPNEPVLMFSEAEIRVVMAEHQPGVSPQYCMCSWTPQFNCSAAALFRVDHLIEKLKEGRHVRLHPAFG